MAKTLCKHVDSPKTGFLVNFLVIRQLSTVQMKSLDFYCEALFDLIFFVALTEFDFHRSICVVSCMCCL